MMTSELGAMTRAGRGHPTDTAFRLSARPLLAGGVLMGAAGLLGLAGLVVSGSALAAALRDWASRQEVPPGELARHHWQRARKATAAGAAAWRDGSREHALRS